MLRRVDFGNEGAEYIRAVLSTSRTLWRYLSALDLKAGHTFGYFTREFPASRLTRFSGGLLDPDEPTGDMIRETDTCLFRGIIGYLEVHSSQHVVIGACPYMSNDWYPPQFFEYWNFEWMAERKAEHQRENRTTPQPSVALIDRYLYQPAGPFSKEQFNTLWEFQPFWSCKCILTASGPPQLFKNEVDESYLRAAAEGAEYILLKAYDGDASLVWSRTKELAERFDTNARFREIEQRQEIG